MKAPLRALRLYNNRSPFPSEFETYTPIHYSRVMSGSKGPSSDMEGFKEHLRKSDRMLALLGAGLSASSGLPTFRGAGGLWRNHDAVELATPESFMANPSLVWQFYSYRRHMALNTQPNKAHFALAELAKRNKNFITLSQNVDGKSPFIWAFLAQTVTIS